MKALFVVLASMHLGIIRVGQLNVEPGWRMNQWRMYYFLTSWSGGEVSVVGHIVVIASAWVSLHLATNWRAMATGNVVLVHIQECFRGILGGDAVLHGYLFIGHKAAAQTRYVRQPGQHTCVHRRHKHACQSTARRVCAHGNLNVWPLKKSVVTTCKRAARRHDASSRGAIASDHDRSTSRSIRRNLRNPVAQAAQPAPVWRRVCNT
jgi:hypothetical protein